MTVLNVDGVPSYFDVHNLKLRPMDSHRLALLERRYHELVHAPAPFATTGMESIHTRSIASKFSQIAERVMLLQSQAFLVTWEGRHSSPVGLKLPDGRVVGSARHGFVGVIPAQGYVGTYVDLRPESAANGKRNAMLLNIWAPRSALTP